MNRHRAFCPTCKTDVEFQEVGGGLIRCPLCGFEYRVSAPPRLEQPAAASGARDILVAVLKVLLIMAAIVAAGVAALFAGCAMLLGGMH